MRKQKITVCNKKFIFNATSVKDILDNMIMPKYSGITYELIESKSSNSIYVNLRKDGIQVPVRLSDHPSHKALRFYNITENTKVKHIVAIFVKNLKRLDKKHTLTLLENLEVEC